MIYENGQIRYVPQKVEIDEKLLRKIAKETGGRYFRATGNKKLDEIYRDIDKMEKTVIEEKRYYNYTEYYRPLLWVALVLMLAGWAVRNVILRQML